MRTFSRRAGLRAGAGLLAVLGVTAGLMASSSAATTSDTTTTGVTSTTGTTVTTSTTTATTTTAAPQSTSAPSVSGSAQEGATLTASTGSWVSSDRLAFAYQWQRCDAHGASCSSIVGATAKTYALESVDAGDTLRVLVTASGASGSATASSEATAVIAAAPRPAPTGCPSVKAGEVADVSQVAGPARLQVAAFQPSPARITRAMQQFTLRVVVTDTCGHPVKGALVYATAVPYDQVTIPAEQATGTDGSVTLTFNRAHRFPASPRQELLALFIRARQPNANSLAGISTRRLVSIPVSPAG